MMVGPMAIKVFYIEDEPELCELFVDFFATSDISIQVFQDPSQAIKEAKINPPDIFFIDYRLPGIYGDEVALLLDPKIPKYLITGELSVDSKYAFTGIINKPYKNEDIEDILKTVLLK